MAGKKKTEVAAASVETESYGALKAYVHLAGYSLERGFKEMDWLLDDGRWKNVGGGFDDVLKFMASLNIEEILPLVEHRKRIAAKLKALQPDTSNRKIADAVKVSHTTIDKAAGNQLPPNGKKDQQSQQTVGNVLPTSSLSGMEAAKAVESAEKKKGNKKNNEQRKADQRASFDNALPDECTLFNCSLTDAEIPTNSIDWIVTDPPYPKEFVSLYADLAKMANKWLKPGGSLLAMAGEQHLPEVLTALTSTGLLYQWTLAYLTPGGQAVQVFPKKVNTFWKPVLWLVKGEYQGKWIGDVVTSKPNDNDKRFHDWGQSESGFVDLIERFATPGESICDPFMGGGTTGVVALARGMKFFGVEKDMETFNLAKSRLSQIKAMSEAAE